jgi:sulfatase maturation enzyme AslB (radical SAM superfamily)
MANSTKVLFKLFKGKLNFGFMNSVETYEYEKFVDIMDRIHDADALSGEAIFPIVINDFDNTARAGNKGVVLNNSNPEKFEKHLSNAINSISKSSSNEKIIFVKSWNEWAEGNYFESDSKWGNGYLKIFKKSIL